MTYKILLNLYDHHIIFTKVVSNKNTDFQFYIFWRVIFYKNVMFKKHDNLHHWTTTYSKTEIKSSKNDSWNIVGPLLLDIPFYN